MFSKPEYHIYITVICLQCTRDRPIGPEANTYNSNGSIDDYASSCDLHRLLTRRLGRQVGNAAHKIIFNLVLLRGLDEW